MIKKISIYFVTFLIFCICTFTSFASTSMTSTNSNCTQPNSYFIQDDPRFKLVDENIELIGNEKFHCYVFTDTVMGTMYLYAEHTVNNNIVSAGMTQIFYEEGSPMIYDEG